MAELFLSLSEPPPELKPRYNVAQSQVVAVVGRKPDGKSRGLALLRWGLVPEWASGPKSAFINARAETVHRLAALPADQRAALARLLMPTADAPAGPTLDDSLPPALERTASLRNGGAKGDVG